MGMIGIACVSFVFILIVQCWVALAPLHTGDAELSSAEIAKNFFSACLALPVVVVFLVYFKIRHKTTFIPLQNIDLDTGRVMWRTRRVKPEKANLSRVEKLKLKLSRT